MTNPMLTRDLSITALLCCGLLCTAACASAPYVWVQERPPDPREAKILVGPGDLLEVRWTEVEQMSIQARVLPDGTITIPVLGSVPVTGKTSAELSRSLEAQLTRYVKTPQVTVIILESLLSVAVIGEVKTAGMIDLVKPATVLQALAKAGGLTEFADSSGIYVLRTEGDKTERIRFDYDRLTEGAPASTRFRLRTGDVVVVE